MAASYSRHHDGGTSPADTNAAVMVPLADYRESEATQDGNIQSISEGSALFIPPESVTDTIEWDYTQNNENPLQWQTKNSDIFINVENNVWTMHEGVYRVQPMWDFDGFEWSNDTTDQYGTFFLYTGDSAQLSWTVPGGNGESSNFNAIVRGGAAVFSVLEGGDVVWSASNSGNGIGNDISAGGVLIISKILGKLVEQQ